MRNYDNPCALDRARRVRGRRDEGYALTEIAEMIERGEAPPCT